MKFERIGYSESVEAVNAIGNKKWFKSNVDITDITDINDEVTRATQLAKEYVKHTIQTSLKENPSYAVDPSTYKEDLIVITTNKEVPTMSTEQRLIADIGTCTEIKVLQSYELLSKKYPLVKEAYDKKLAELKA